MKEIPQNVSKSVRARNPHLFGIRPPIEVSAEPNERSLHDKIEAYCRDRRWPYVHSRMDMATTNQKGVPDFVIAADNGRTLWIECKSKTGKMRPEQLGFKLMLENSGHKYYIVRSMDEFISLRHT